MKKIALFGPGNVIYPVEEELISDFFHQKGLEPNVIRVHCNGLTVEAILSRMKSPTLLGGERAVVLREFFKSALDDVAPLKGFFEKGGTRGAPELVILEDEAPPTKKVLKELVSLFDETRDLSLHGLSKQERRKKVRQLVQDILYEMDKQITKDAMELLLHSIDTHDPSCVKTELEKLAATTGGRARITVDDVTNVVVTSRQDEVYALTDFLATGDVRQALNTLENLLGHGVHPLALLQVLNTWLLRLYLLKIVFSVPPPDPLSIEFDTFKEKALPKLVAQLGDPLPWPFKGVRPYAIFNMWRASLNFPQDKIYWAISEISRLDLRLKGCSSGERAALEIFLLHLVAYE